jgi:hypothetical protein
MARAKKSETISMANTTGADITLIHPITPAAGRHCSQTIRYVENFVSNSPMLAAAALARRELGWLVNSAVLACFPNSTLDAASSSTSATRHSLYVAR